MQEFKSDLFGEIPAPSSFEEFASLVKDLQYDERPARVHYWRGQADISWPLHSGAYRRLERTHKETDFSHLKDVSDDAPAVSDVSEELLEILNNVNRPGEERLRAYEKVLLHQAEHQGYRQHAGRRLNELETLARLQHYGAATRLLDFTKNMFIGLWFACEDSKFEDRYGLLCGVSNKRVVQTNLRLHEPDPLFDPQTATLAELLDQPKAHKTFIWEPPRLTPRIAAQHAVFAYSKVVSQPHGTLHIDEEGEPVFIAISPALKASMRPLFRATFNYSIKTLFPDVEGFSRANSVRYSIKTMRRW